MEAVSSYDRTRLWYADEIRQLIREEIAKAQPTIQVITPPNYSVKQETMMLTEDGHETVEEYHKARENPIEKSKPITRGEPTKKPHGDYYH